jgi:hypothetical protein
MTYTPLTKITQAIGSPEGDNLKTPTQIANDIIYDKTTLINVLHSFGVPADLSDDLITLINKVAPISINYVENFTDTWLDQTSALTGNTDSVATLIASSVTPSVPSDTFTDQTSNFTGNNQSGNVFLGGDATNTTKSIAFVIINVIDSVTLQIDSTSGMTFGDTIQQGVNTTTINNILDATHMIVASTSGFVASSLVSTF